MTYSANGYPVYGNYPQMYQPTAQPMQAPAMPVQAQQPQSSNGLIWVQGETGAKSYLVAAGCSVLLMDSESQRFYIKTVDESGMPRPLRVFEYAELLPNAPTVPAFGIETDPVQYATKEELQEKIREMQEKIDRISERFNRKDERRDGKPTV